MIKGLMSSTLLLSTLAFPAAHAASPKTFAKPVAWNCVYHAADLYFGMQLFSTPGGAVDASIERQFDGEIENEPLNVGYEIVGDGIVVLRAQTLRVLKPGDALPKMILNPRPFAILKWKKGTNQWAGTFYPPVTTRKIQVTCTDDQAADKN